MNGYRFQIEHIIPYSCSFDDSIHNKVISAAWVNKLKGNKTPYEAFHKETGQHPGIVWAEIQQRVKKLPPEQQWRFSKNAMEMFEERKSPIARSLNDTRYMTRLLQQYLRPIVREDGKKTVQAVAGQLTAMVRKSWGLNLYKNKEEKEAYRSFHNHHAIDAMIVAMINRGQIEEVAFKLKQARNPPLEYFKDDFDKLKDTSIPEKEKYGIRKKIREFIMEREAGVIKQYIPCPTTLHVPDILKRVQNINISHKPKLKYITDFKSTVGQLHEDTAYGLKSFVDDVSLIAYFKTGNNKDKKITEKAITEYIPIFYRPEDKQAYYDAFKNWFIIERKAKTLKAQTAADKQIKKACTEKEQNAVQALRLAAQKAFKWFVGGSNFCAEIYEVSSNNKINGLPTTNAGKWESEIISNYNATIRVHRGEPYYYWKHRYPNARRVMSLKRHDMVQGTFTKEQAYSDDFPKGIQEYTRQIFAKNPLLEQTAILFRVKKISSSGTIFLTPHNIAKEVNDTKSWIASAGSLQKYRAQKVFVSPTGRILHAK